MDQRGQIVNCTELRQFLFAFLDNELESGLSIDVQHHIEHCPLCAREAEIERMVRKRMGSALGVEVRELPSLEGLLAGLVGAAGSSAGRDVPARAMRIWPRNGLLAVAAAVLLAVGLIWQFGSGGSAAQRPSLTRLVVADFEHFVEEGQVLQITSSDRATVSAWLEEKTGMGLGRLDPADTAARLRGGRKCNLDGEIAAFAVFDLKGKPVSLVVVDDSVIDLYGMQQAACGRSMCWAAKDDSYHVVACRRRGLIYAAVAELPRETMLTFLANEIP